MLDAATELKDQFAAELRQKAKAHGLTGASIARAIEAETRTVNQWLAGRNEPGLSDIAKLCKLLRINPASALGLAFLEEDVEFELVEAFDVRAAAGAGAVVDDEQAKFNLAFRADWLRRVTNAPLNRLKIIEADRDSMMPTINPGDHMLVDTTQTDPRQEGIYVIQWDGALNVKRISVTSRKRLVIQSDNAAYAPERDVRPDDVAVIGRVIWIGRRT